MEEKRKAAPHTHFLNRGIFLLSPLGSPDTGMDLQSWDMGLDEWFFLRVLRPLVLYHCNLLTALSLPLLKI